MYSSSLFGIKKMQERFLFCFVFCANVRHDFLCLRGTILEESRPKNAIFSWTVQQMESWILIYLKVEGLEPLILIMYLTLGTIRNCNSKVTVLLTFREQRAFATVNNILYCYLFQFSTRINFRTSCHLLSSAMLALVLQVSQKEC